MVKNAKYLALMALTLTLAACDNKADEQANAQQPQAGEVAASSSLPEAPLPEGEPMTSEGAPGAISGDLSEGEGSMAETSPAGAVVTEQELPHSDVPPPSREAFTDASCDFEAWVGKPVDEGAIKATGRDYRILKPGSMMTMDHSPERINVEHDDGGVVTRVWCG